MNIGLPNQITAANAGERQTFAGKSRVGLSPWPGVAGSLGGVRTVKSIASFFPKREHKPNPALQLVVTPTQTLVASVIVLIVAVCPLLTVQFGRPTSWFGNFLLLLCAIDGSINAQQRTRRERRGGHRCVPCAGSLLR
jgi:hypothetical protein